MSKFDLHIESLPTEKIRNMRCMSFGNYTRSLSIRGVQKMVNRFVKCFLTPLGSDLADADYGTPLASAFLGNSDSHTLYSLATRSVSLAEQKMREYDAEYGTPENERLNKVTTHQINVDPAGPGVEIVLSLTNAAGVTVQTAVSQIVGYTNG